MLYLHIQIRHFSRSKILILGQNPSFWQHWNHKNKRYNTTLLACVTALNTHARGVICVFVSLVLKIIVICLSIRPSVTEGQWKRFDLKTQGAVRLALERKKLQLGILCEHKSRY